MNLEAKAIQAINRRGALLVYPLNNRREPLSLWSELYPRTKMRWEWDEDGDDRVAKLWHLREKLSTSRKVVYAKWFQGRATLFSFDVFVNLLAYLRGDEIPPQSADILEMLLNDSPLSTRQVKALAELEGRLNEPAYNRAMKPLWARLQIVGFGEFEDSSFPSLGIGASASLFEDLWREAQARPRDDAEKNLRATLGESNPFFKYAVKIACPSKSPRSIKNLEPANLRRT